MQEKEFYSIATYNNSVQLLFTRGKAPDLPTSGQRVHKQFPFYGILHWYTFKQVFEEQKL